MHFIKLHKLSITQNIFSIPKVNFLPIPIKIRNGILLVSDSNYQMTPFLKYVEIFLFTCITFFKHLKKNSIVFVQFFKKF